MHQCESKQLGQGIYRKNSLSQSGMWSIAWWRQTVSSCSISLYNITRQRIPLQYSFGYYDKQPSYQEKQWLITITKVILSSVWNTSCLNQADQKLLLFFLYFPGQNSIWRQVESPFNLVWPHQLLEKRSMFEKISFTAMLWLRLSSFWNSVWYQSAFEVCFNLKHNRCFMLFSMPT